ncbi:MAG TPA: hypothetical protein VNZ49_14220 [Bacteroidia bacterium]|nr:hypothetical protein [Bacteroidia bacterium]
MPKRIDSLYCSHSCRQLAYVLRKASTGNTIDGLKTLTYKPDPIVIQQTKQESSIEPGAEEKYPSTESVKTAENVNELTDKKPDPSIKESVPVNYPSIVNNETVKKESVLPVNTDKKESTPEIKQVNTVTKPKEEPEQYKQYNSAFLLELFNLTEARDYHFTLYRLLHNNKESSAYWISLRFRCLVECLLTFSEMQFIDLNDLKEVCNAFTNLIQSRSFKYLPSNYPYTKDIVQLRDTIKNLCLNADEDEEFTFRFKKETRLKIIATRWELASQVPKTTFSQLKFTE